MTESHHLTAVHVASQIADALEATAHWRLEKAEQYPDDDRNRPASELASRLAAEVRTLTDLSDLERLAKVWADDDGVYEASELESEARRHIGFHCFPDNGADFVRYLADELEARLAA